MGAQQSLYSKLDSTSHQIRLIHIQPGVWDDPILCELHLASLNSSPIYETLSYTWGEPTPTKPILVDTCVLDVRANLWDALRRLRCASKERIIWIDALCINQDDFEERSQQVLLMGRIYSSCLQVIMWLGDGLEEFPVDDRLSIEEGTKISPVSFDNRARREVDDAFNIIQLLGSSHTNEHLIELPCVRPFTQDHMEGDDISQSTARWGKGWKALKSVMTLPYWRRIWIVQEVILPSNATVALGSISMSWAHFSAAALALVEHSRCCKSSKFQPILLEATWHFHEIVSNLSSSRLSRSKSLSSLTLGEMLPTYFDRKATDPRDKLYGVLSFAQSWEDQQLKIIPNYSPLNTTRKLFGNLTIHLLDSMKSFQLFTGHCPRRHEENYPSWILDWGQEPDAGEWRADVLRMATYDYYKATKNSPLYAVRLSDERLKVRGLCLGDVRACGPCKDESQMVWDVPTLGSILQLHGEQKLPTDIYIGDETWADIHWRALFGNLLFKVGEGFRPMTDDDKFISVVYRGKYIFEYEEFLRADPDEEISHQGNLPVKATLDYRRVFITKHGTLGFGPKNMQTGDQVFIIAGSNVPFILRASESKSAGSSEVEYRLIGDCYVHGIMDGEAYEAGWNELSTYVILC